MQNIISLDFKFRMSESALYQFAANISKHITEDAAFSSLKEEGLVLLAKTKAFSDAIQAAADGSRTLIAEKRQIKAELLKQLEKTSSLVNALAEGNEAIVLQSGFLPRDKSYTRTSTELSLVTRLTAKQGTQPGEVLLEYDVVPQALMYATEWSADDGKTWHNGIYPSSHRAVIQGLPVRQDVLFRVCALGTGQRKGRHSDPIRMFVM